MGLTVDIWSDIACPWCYIGKRRLEAALEGFAHRDAVEIRWHAFELDPSAPSEVDRSVPYTERLARKYRTSAAQAQAMMDHMTARAAEDGIEMRFDKLRASNTFDAHRVLSFAAEHGKQGALKERLLAAYFTEGELMSDPATLARLAAQVGLEADEVAGVLATEQHADQVRADESEAGKLGIHGVPFFVFDSKLGVSGAQPVETMVQVLERAWAEGQRPDVVTAGEACGPDGCA